MAELIAPAEFGIVEDGFFIPDSYFARQTNLAIPEIVLTCSSVESRALERAELLPLIVEGVALLDAWHVRAMPVEESAKEEKFGEFCIMAEGAYLISANEVVSRAARWIERTSEYFVASSFECQFPVKEYDSTDRIANTSKYVASLIFVKHKTLSVT